MRSAIVKATCEKIVTAAVAAIALSAASTVWAGEPAATLRLATYNIHQGMGKFDKKFKYAIREQLEYLEWEKLDVFGLNEVNWHIERSGMADAPADIAAFTGRHVEYAAARNVGKGNYGNAVVSKEKPISTMRVDLPRGNGQKGLKCSLMLCEFKDYWFGSTHLEVRSAITNQLKSVEILRKVVAEKSKTKPVFLSGDWNNEPDSITLAKMGEFMTILNDPKERTYNGFSAKPKDDERCIDYIAVDNAHAHLFKVAERRVKGWSFASDHNPVIVTLETPHQASRGNQDAQGRLDAKSALPVVVVPDKPTEVEKFAAKELSGELGKCLGETPKIIGESAARGLAALPCGDSPEDGRACRPATTARLYVGATQAAKAARADGTGCRPYQVDEVFLKSVNDGVVLDGDPARAVIYAVDLYLEKYCGVRWWTDDASHHPTLKEVPAEGIDLRYAPQFKYRETYYRTGLDPLFKVRSKGNFTSLTRCIHLLPEVKFIPPEMGGNHRLYFFEGRRSAYHSFFEILPPKVYFDKHPEWYSLIKGKREAKQLCLANEEMKAEYIRETMRRLREDPAVDFIQVSQNDGYGGWCECEKCKALMDEDGGVVSGPYLRFANAVAEAVEREFPKVRIDTFAYVFTTDPPAKTRPRDNMVVRFCVYKCDISRRLDDETSPRNLAFRRNLEAWSRIAGGRLFIWNYLADFHAGMLPHPNISQIAPDVRLFAANGAVGVFQQGDPLCVAGTFANLRHYIAAHLLWNPSEDERRLMDEFLYGYYGQDAAPHLKRFIAFLDASARKEGQPVKMNHEGMEFLTVDEQLALAAIMDDAVEAAERDGEPFAARVRRERLSVDNYVLMNYDALRDLAVRKGMKWTRPQSRAEAVENWIREVKSFGVVAVRETMDADNIDKYFEKLRRGDANPTVP